MKTISGIFILLFSLFSVFAQTTATEKEIILLRENIVNAIKLKDDKSLQLYFVEGFTHTHAIGKVDDKKTRLKVLLSGDETIDTTKPDNFTIKLFGKNLAVVQGQTTFKGAPIKIYQWTYVYQKTKGKWQVILSHASPKNE
jgi:hypothetical protein